MENNIYIDPAFLRKSNYSYVNYRKAELSSVLCFALARNKNDLILHQQRIEYHAKQEPTEKQRELLFTSIVDLFTALNDKGGEYKSRILDKYKKQLTSQQAILLTKAVVAVISETDSIPELKQSLLNLGNSGKLLSSDTVSGVL